MLWIYFGIKLACQYEHEEIVPGTSSYHQLCWVSVDEIGYKRVSDDNDMAGTSVLVRQQIQNKFWQNFCQGM